MYRVAFNPPDWRVYGISRGSKSPGWFDIGVYGCKHPAMH